MYDHTHKSFFNSDIVFEDMQEIISQCLHELKTLANKKILITGASGFVGRYLVESIAMWNRTHANSSCTLLLPTRSISMIENKMPHLMGLEHLQWFEWENACLSHIPKSDYVIHAASPVEPSDYLDDAYHAMQSMVMLTDSVLKYCQRYRIKRMLYLSSGAIYGTVAHDQKGILESDSGSLDFSDSRFCYAETKRYCEMLCRLSAVDVVIARLFSFIGPYLNLDSSYAASSFIKSADVNKSITLQSDGSAQRTYCYASDLTIMLWKLLIQGKSGAVYNAGSSSPVVSIGELAQYISQVMDVPIHFKTQKTIGNRHCYVPSTLKLSSLYHAQTPWRKGLDRTLYSMFEQHKIKTPINDLRSDK